MKRIFFSCTLMLLLVGVTSLAPSAKVKYNSTEGKLSVTFPADFSLDEQLKDSYKSVKAQTIFNDMVFLVNYTIHESEVSDNEELAKISLDAFVGGMEGKIDKETTWKVNKQNGLQALVSTADNSLKGEYRVVIIDQIQYQITAISAGESWDAKVAKKFFKSFKVKK